MNRSQGISVSLAAVALVTASLAGCRAAPSTRPGVVTLQSSSQPSSQPAPQPTSLLTTTPASRPTTSPTGPLATLFHTAGGYCALCTALKDAQLDPETNRPITPPTVGDTGTGDGDLLRDLPR